ncbi:MAG: putative serine protease HhoA precursor [bacterium ADurb.Bin363]|nr:MAG: putative serine protease HhoA precursor [bacterium ADurb.Bin363]
MKISAIILLLLSAAICAAIPDTNKAVVMIQIVKQPYDYTTPWKQTSISQGVGSGFIIEGNRILTNAHNVSDSRFIIVKKENLAKKYTAEVEFVGHDCDLAILKVIDDSFFKDTEPLKIGGLPQVNSTVVTYGFPMGGTHISVTEGVVSRIQTDVYIHSGADSHLVIQSDAAINPGNSGGPVIMDGNVVGVAFQGMRQADNIGYMIPTTVINHFLDDIKDGNYDGFGSLGVTIFDALHNESYKEFLKVPPQTEGVVVTSVLLNSSAEKVLNKNDCITNIDGRDIDNDGMITIYGQKYSLSEAVEAKQIGEKVDIVFWRNGRQHKTQLEIQLNRPVFEFARVYDNQPRYICFAGLTFVTASRNFLETWGREWLNDIPHTLRYLLSDSQILNKDPQRKEYVILSEILPDEINVYDAEFINKPVESINNKPVRSIEDLRNAFANKETEFYILKFMSSQIPLLLDSKQAHQRNQSILKKYNVPAWSYPEGQI